MRKVFIIASLLLSVSAHTQNKNEEAIRTLLNTQMNAWNEGDIDVFMQGYWKNDSLVFVGSRGATYGWQPTLDNYKKGYPDRSAMGKLDFTFIEFKELSTEYYFVIGKWHLARTIGDVGGHFTLLFKKINGQWLIIADHSS